MRSTYSSGFVNYIGIIGTYHNVSYGIFYKCAFFFWKNGMLSVDGRTVRRYSSLLHNCIEMRFRGKEPTGP